MGDHVELRFPPPSVPLLFVAVGATVHLLRDLPGLPMWLRGLGVGLLLAGLGVLSWALVVMVRAGGDPEPKRPDHVLVEGGPFALGRNPIYLGLLLSQTGLGLATAWWLVTALVPLSWAWLRFGVIAKEEAHLRARFGAPYEDYCQRVRRWF